MDTETADAFERLSHDVRNGLRDLRTELRAEIGEFRTGLHAEIGELGTELRAEIAGLRSELGDEIREVRLHGDEIATGFRAEIQDVKRDLRTEIQDVKRHSDVIAESLRGEIRLVAEGVAGLDEKFTPEFRNVREEIGEVKNLLRLSYADLDRRILAARQATAKKGAKAADGLELCLEAIGKIEALAGSR